jgi:hypothetical protein
LQITLFFSFSIAGGFLPLILRAKGIDTSLPIDTTYRNYGRSSHCKLPWLQPLLTPTHLPA